MTKKIQKTNKSNLLKLFLSNELDLTPQLNKEIFERFFSIIIQHIENKQSIELRNFGSFRIKKMPSRIGSNPQNGEKIYIPEKFKLSFKVSKKILEKINE
jgi:integration host factor subunit beta